MFEMSCMMAFRSLIPSRPRIDVGGLEERRGETDSDLSGAVKSVSVESLDCVLGECGRYVCGVGVPRIV